MRYQKFVTRAAVGAFVGDRTRRYVAKKGPKYRQTAETMFRDRCPKEFFPLVFVGLGLGLCVTSLVATHHVLFPMVVGDWVYASAKTVTSSFSKSPVK